MLVFRDKESGAILNLRVEGGLSVHEVFGDEYIEKSWEEAMQDWLNGPMNIDAIPGYEIAEVSSND